MTWMTFANLTFLDAARHFSLPLLHNRATPSTTTTKPTPTRNQTEIQQLTTAHIHVSLDTTLHGEEHIYVGSGHLLQSVLLPARS
jgi:hypothetical protein